MKPHIRELCEQLTSNDDEIDIELDLSESNDDDLELVFQVIKAHHRGRPFSLCCQDGTLSVRSALSLASVLRECPGVKYISFNEVRIEEFSAIAFVIQRRCRGSTELGFSGCFLSPSVMVGLRFILGSDALCSLNITSCNLGEGGAPLDLSGALRNNRSLRELTIKHDGLSITRMTVSRATFRDIPIMLRTNQGIHSLSLSRIGMPTDLLSSISLAADGHSSLSTLEVNGCQLDFSTIPSVAGMLQNTPNLQILDLSYCSLGRFPLQDLATALASKECSLTHLDVSNNVISDEGARVVRSILVTNQTILTLVLSNNNISDIGATFLESALAGNTTLLTLILESNQIGPSGAKSIARALCTNNSLRSLILGGNPIGEDGAACIARMLTSNCSLHNIGVDGFGKDGFQAFTKNLPNMNGLQYLGFHQDVADLTVDLGYAFVESLELNTSLCSVVFSVRDERFRSEVIPKIKHLLMLNRGGRRILKSATHVPASLWPRVLGRSSRNADAIYHFLHEKPDVFFCNGRTGKRKRDEDDPSPSAPDTGRRHTDTGIQYLPVSGRPPTMSPVHQGFYMQPHSVAHHPQYNQFLFPPHEAARVSQYYQVPQPSQHMAQYGCYQIPMASPAAVSPQPQLWLQHPGFPMSPQQPSPQNPFMALTVAAAPPHPPQQRVPAPPHLAPTSPNPYRY